MYKMFLGTFSSTSENDVLLEIFAYKSEVAAQCSFIVMGDTESEGN